VVRLPDRHPAIDWDDDRRTDEFEKLIERRVPGSDRTEKLEWVAQVTGSKIGTVRAWVAPNSDKRIPAAKYCLLVWALEHRERQS
jgi:hypothetical protein